MDTANLDGLIFPRDIYTPLTQTISKDLDKLAEQLAYNYFSNSFGESDKRRENWLPIFSNSKTANDFKVKFNNFQRDRNILIIGAGVSHDSFASIPLSTTMKDEMEEEYGTIIRGHKFLRDRFEHEEEDIRAMTGKHDISFENYFYLLSKHFVLQQDLREKIKQMTDIRYAPCLFNEIAAHMLKHSFFDVVINFNFEETLDQSIEDEIGAENYYKVISDGHAVNIDKVLVDGRLKTPIYIKPHGSNSHKSTLRFTNDHYFDLPVDIKDMLQKILKGRLELDDNKGMKKINKVNLVVVGFALQSVEFNKLLRIKKEEASDFPEYEIFHLDVNPFFSSTNNEGSMRDLEFANHFPSMNFPNQFNFKELVRDESFAKKIDYTPIPVPSSNLQDAVTTPLGEIMSVLWRKVYYTFKEPFFPRSIGRHEILSYLLYDSKHSRKGTPREELYETYEPPKKEDGGDKENYCDYLLDKLMIELMLSINRNNGLIDIVEVLKLRVGEYYHIYRENKKNECCSIYEMVADLCYGPKEGGTQKQFLNPKNYIKLKDELADELKNGKKQEVFDRMVADLRIKLTTTVYQNCTAGVDKFIKALNDEYKQINEKQGFTRVFTLLIRLLLSDKVSRRLKCQLVTRYGNIVYNGKNKGETLLNEVIRSMAKGVSSHYYIINPRQNNPIHYMFESYSKDDVQHTNLAYIHEFSYFFDQSDKWDIALIVAETGGIFGYLKTQAPRYKLYKGKKINLICCYERVLQLYPKYANKQKMLDADELRQLEKDHIDELGLKGLSDNGVEIELMFEPAREHNHHMALFLKRNEVKPGKTDDVISHNVFKAIYLFRQGFSNSIDPIVLKKTDNNSDDHIENDYWKLFSLFFRQVIRAENFKKEFMVGEKKASQVNEQGSQEAGQSDIMKEHKQDDFSRAKLWSDEVFNERLQEYFTRLFKH